MLRVARPSDDLERLLPFYRDGLGLRILYRFEDHDGFDGIMAALNPYWDRDGVTFEDPDGYRIVLQNAAWSPGPPLIAASG